LAYTIDIIYIDQVYSTAQYNMNCLVFLYASLLTMAETSIAGIGIYSMTSRGLGVGKGEREEGAHNSIMAQI
jgi:hypothetical protein